MIEEVAQWAAGLFRAQLTQADVVLFAPRPDVVARVEQVARADLAAALSPPVDPSGRRRHDQMPVPVVRALAACPGPPPPAECPRVRSVG